MNNTSTEIMTLDQLIVVEQLPIITEKLQQHAAVIDKRLSIVDDLVCTEESLKEVKKVRADFNKESAAAHELFRAAKDQVLMRWNEVETAYNECIRDKYRAADITLKSKIGDVESELTTRKIEGIKVYFNEYATTHSVTEYADFRRQMSDIKRSSSDAMLKRICQERIDSIVNGLRAIETQPEVLQAEILAEFKRTLKATEAITVVSERHKAMARQKAAQEARKAELAAKEEAERKAAEAVIPQSAQTPQPKPQPMPQPLAPPKEPVADPDPIKTVTFTVTDRLSKLKLLKAFIIEGGYKYE